MADEKKRKKEPEDDENSLLDDAIEVVSEIVGEEIVEDFFD